VGWRAAGRRRAGGASRGASRSSEVFMIVGATRGLLRSSVRYRTVAPPCQESVRFSIAAVPASRISSYQPVRQAVPSIDRTRSAAQIFPAVPTPLREHVVTEARTRSHAPRRARGRLLM
jgi:hypothetical protein